MRKILCILLVFLMLMGTCVTSLADENISQDLTNKVKVLSKLNIINGYPDGTIRPENYLTRAEFTKIAVSASSYRNSVPNDSTTSPYIDVEYSNWAAPYVNVAVSNNLITGYPDATFRPDQNVTLEETVTIFLRILGYTDSDFGSSWPYGQLGLANDLKLTDGVSAKINEPVTRQDAIIMLYQLLNTKSKNASTDYITNFRYSIAKDVILIATSKEDASIGSDKILTSNGTYDLRDSLLDSDLHKTGDILIDGSDNSIALFMPHDQVIKTYSIYSVVGNDIMIDLNGEKKVLDLDDDTIIYNKSQKSTLNAMLSTIETGSQLNVYYSNDGELEYAFLDQESLSDPITVLDDNWQAQIDLPNISTATIYRDSSPAALSDITKYDVLYYSKTLNTIWAYCKKVTGIYENALPNMDMLTSVVVSGKTYPIESAEAFKKLSSTGQFKYGDTVTLLYGNNDNVVDVISTTSINQTLTGYVIETGQKSFQNSQGNAYNSYYVNTVLADGSTLEIPTKSDYKTYKCSLADMQIVNGIATLTPVNTSLNSIDSLSGTVDIDNMLLGTTKIAPDIKILDIGNIDSSGSPLYTTVFLKRLENVTLSQERILKYIKNSKDEIESLFLNKVTGDYNDYGIVLKATTRGSGFNESGTYQYDIGGTVSSFSSNSVLFSVESGSPAAFTKSSTNSIENIVPLIKVTDPVESVTETTVTTANATYPISDKTVVYQQKDGNYFLVPITGLIGKDLKSTYAFYDRHPKNGGLVRVLVIYEN